MRNLVVGGQTKSFANNQQDRITTANMNNVGIVVENLDNAISFFTETLPNAKPENVVGNCNKTI